MNNIDLSKAKSRKRPEFFSEQVREARWFYLDLAPPADVPLAVVCGGCELCQVDYTIHRTTFAYTAIEFVADGRGSLVLAGQASELLPGTVFFYAGDVAHHITTDPKQPLVKYFVNFTGSHGAELLQTCGLAPGTHGRVFAPAKIQAVFDGLIQDGVKGTRFSGTLCACAGRVPDRQDRRIARAGRSDPDASLCHLSTLSPAHSNPTRPLEISWSDRQGVSRRSGVSLSLIRPVRSSVALSVPHAAEDESGSRAATELGRARETGCSRAWLC